MQKSEIKRPGNSLRAVADVQLFNHCRSMGLDGARRYPKQTTNLMVRESLAQQSQRFDLPRRQR